MTLEIYIHNSEMVEQNDVWNIFHENVKALAKMLEENGNTGLFHVISKRYDDKNPLDFNNLTLMEMATGKRYELTYENYKLVNSERTDEPKETA
ncbi:hypothetical protein JCM19239_6818 [Vibrio variabilis]|uniref:Uncharacterized protein n=1 Tax=Vibrio variabilis TaxID=990271 RepID=A0ABQ0JPC1_9VIBR|nr:hypothetical protein JCM19239_6818 [Vibrio variabilis]